MPSDLATQLAHAEAPKFEVWPENMRVIETWVMICSQWRVVSLADGRVHYEGLDYSAVKAGLELAGQIISPVIWAGVQVMERAAASALNGFAG